MHSYDQIPLFGHSPPFDWNHFSTLASARFGVPKLSIHPVAQGYRSSGELKEGLGDDILVFPLKAGPLEGSAFWMMSRENIAKITSWMINGQVQARPLSSEVLAEGFYRYLLLQIMETAVSMDPLQKLSLVLSESSRLPETNAYCIDVEIGLDKHSCWGRLVIDPLLSKSWAQYFSHPTPETLLSKQAKSLELVLGVKVGSSLLRSGEWKQLKRGDFLRLDQGSYDPRKHNGAAYLMLGSAPLFQVKIKQNKLQLIDYAFMYEEQMAESKLPEPETFAGPAEQLLPDEGKAVSLKELPIYLTVELGRMKITLEKLMQLTPGNLIELPIHPDQSVKLTVNGQLVGHAELVHLGEALGVRILDLG